MEKTERLAFFAELVRSCHELYLWSYDADMTLVSSNCPLETTMEALLNMDGMKQRIQSYALENNTPIILENSLSFLWIAAPDKGTERSRACGCWGRSS